MPAKPHTNMSPRDSRLSSTRAGFSLLEIMIVVALMVTVAAMMLPSMDGFFNSQKLVKAADRVRTEMGRARVEAIRSGDVYAFYFRPQMTSYTVAPFESTFDESRFGQEMVDGVDDRGTDANLDEERLPRGVVFAAAESPEDARVAQVMSELEYSQVQSVRPILFYPDGTSQNATIILMNEQQDKYKITLRGLTGSASAAPYYSAR